MSTVEQLIKQPVSQVFRKAQIKRRDISTGQFESDWHDISGDVKSYGKISNKIDSARRFKFTFGTAKLIMQNNHGRYNPSDSPASLWFGFLNQQRTLVRIQAGFLNPTKNDSGIWSLNPVPQAALWDESVWDEDEDTWDDDTDATVFTGLVSGDILQADKNEIVLNLRPLTSVFQDFPASNLTGWTSTGMTASQFVTMVRDQQDTSGNYIFRPFFGNTTTNWDISTTTNVFSNLNTSGADGVADTTVWEVFEKLAEAENFIPYVNRQAVFKFISRTSVEASVVFEFHGAGSFNSTYGHTIKSVDNYGFRISNYYSRVQIKWVNDNTTSAFEIEVAEQPLSVSGSNNPWVLGVRTLEIENYYIPSAIFAQALAQSIFTDVSGFKREIDFTTTFIPHLDLLDRFSIYYDPSAFIAQNLWDQNNWAADTSISATDLIWDNADGDTIAIDGTEFKFLSQEIDLDNFSNKFIAREV